MTLTHVTLFGLSHEIDIFKLLHIMYLTLGKNFNQIVNNLSHSLKCLIFEHDFIQSVDYLSAGNWNLESCFLKMWIAFL